MSSLRFRARADFWFGYWLPSFLIGWAARSVVRRGAFDPPQRVAVLVPEYIGDVVLSGPLLRALSGRFPAADLIALAPPSVAPLLEACPYVRTVVAWPPGLRAALCLGWRLRRMRPDLVLVPRADPDRGWAPMVAIVSGAPRRLGLTDAVGWPARIKRLQAAPLFSATVRPAVSVHHERLRRLTMAQYLGAELPGAELEIWTTPADTERAGAFLATLPSGRSRVAIGLGASAAQRVWPPERFAEVIDRLAEHGAIVPLLIGSQADEARVAAVRAVSRTPVFFLAEATLRESAVLLRSCALFIGNDSGPAHLAAAAGVPVVVISSYPVGGAPGHPNSPAKCGPACAVARVVQPSCPAGAECSGGCVAERAHCILGVTVEAVVAAAESAQAEASIARQQGSAR